MEPELVRFFRSTSDWLKMFEILANLFQDFRLKIIPGVCRRFIVASFIAAPFVGIDRNVNALTSFEGCERTFLIMFVDNRPFR